jgi:hypothetical protein
VAHKIPYAGYFYSIRRQARSDGVFYWHWDISDQQNWPVESGNVFGAFSNAVDQVREAIWHRREAQQRA